MATIVANLSDLHTCETTSGAVGNKPVLDNEIFKQGSNSLGFTVTQNKVSGVSFTSVDLTGEHVRLWYTSITFPNMQSKANNGLRFYVTDGSNNTAYWQIAGNDTYFGGWLNIVVDMDSTPDSGSFDKTDVEEIGVEIAVTSTPKNLTNTWIDYARYGDGLTAYGAASFSMEEIYQDDLTNGYGIVDKNESVYNLSGSIILGDSAGSNATLYEEDGSVLVFTDKNVSSNLYKIEAVGNATGDTEVVFLNCVITSAGPIYDLDFDSADIESVDISGCQISGADEILLATMCTINGTVFNACGQITPGAAEFHNNTVSNSTATNALVWVGVTSDVEYCTFKGNTNAIVIASTADQTFVGLIFGTGGDANTADVNNTSGEEIDVAKTLGSNPTTSTGSTVNFTSEFLLTLTGLVNDTEVRAYTGDPGDSPTLIAFTESVTGNEFQFSHSVDGSSGYIVFINPPDYLYKKVVLTYQASNQTLPVEQIKDRNTTK